MKWQCLQFDDKLASCWYSYHGIILEFMQICSFRIPRAHCNVLSIPIHIMYSFSWIHAKWLIYLPVVSHKGVTLEFMLTVSSILITCVLVFGSVSLGLWTWSGCCATPFTQLCSKCSIGACTSLFEPRISFLMILWMSCSFSEKSWVSTG